MPRIPIPDHLPDRVKERIKQCQDEVDQIEAGWKEKGFAIGARSTIIGELMLSLFEDLEKEDPAKQRIVTLGLALLCSKAMAKVEGEEDEEPAKGEPTPVGEDEPIALDIEPHKDMPFTMVLPVGDA